MFRQTKDRSPDRIYHPKESNREVAAFSVANLEFTNGSLRKQMVESPISSENKFEWCVDRAALLSVTQGANICIRLWNRY